MTRPSVVPEETKSARPLRKSRAPLLGGLAVIVSIVVWLALSLTHSAPPPPTAPGGASPSTPTPARVHTALGTRALSGEVQDDRGTPLANALVRVTAMSAEAPATREASSDEKGRFRVDRLPTDALWVEVTREGHEAKERTFAPEGGDEHVTFVLPRQGELRVSLRDSPGQPVERTEIVITGPGLWPAQAARADARGEHVFKGLPAGSYRVRARRGPRIALPGEPVTVVPGERTQTELVLVEGAYLSGSVLDAQTKGALGGTRITIQDLTPGIDALELVTDAQGAFEASGLWPGAVRIEAQRDGYASAVRDVVLPVDQPLTLALVGAASLSGIVVDETGRAVSGARLSVATEEGLPVELASEGPTRPAGELGVTSGPVPQVPLLEGGEFALGTLATQSDGTGRFRIARLSPAPLALYVAHAGFLSTRVAVSDLKPHAEKAGLRVVLRAAGRVLGRIVDARGRGLSGVYVAVRSADGEKSTVTNDEGEYRVADVLGELSVEAAPDGHAMMHCRTVVEAGGEGRCDLTVTTELHELLVRVVDDHGMELEGAVVKLTARAATARSAGGDSGSAEHTATQLTRRDGTVRLRELPAPPYLLEARLQGHVHVRSVPVASIDREVRIQLARAATLAGIVVDSLGRAVPDATVECEDASARGRTDARGRFELDGVMPGPQVLVARRERAGEGRSAQVRARPAERLDDVRIMLSGRYQGEVADAGSEGGTSPARAAREERASDAREERADFVLEQRGRALVLTQIAPGSAAAKAGFRAGDVLTAIDDEVPLSVAHARGMLRDPPGRAAVVRVLRSKRPVNLRYRRPAF